MQLRPFVAGGLAVALALAVGEFLAGVFLAAPSLLDAVGQALIPRFPGPVTTWAIAVFGSANRAVLLTGIVVVALVVGGALGRLAVRSFPTAAVVVAAVGAAGLVAALQQPGAGFPVVLLAVTGAVAAGVVALHRLTAPARAAASAPDRPVGPAGTPTDPQVGRRDVLRVAAGVGVAAVVLGGTGRVLVRARGGAVDPSAIALPRPARALPAAAGPDLAQQLDGVTPLFTPTEEFFRIDTALGVPRIDPDTWRLRVHGHVDRAIELSYDDLLAMPLEEVDATIACVSNEVGGELIGTARWLGVPLATVLERAGVRPEGDQVVGRAVDGWTAGFPTGVALDGRRALVAVGMNGEALPARHGFPARLIVPGLFGYVSATKWLTELELTGWEDYDAYWIPRGWSKEGPVKTGSRIDLPDAGAQLPSGPVVVAGVAWAPTRGVERVEIRLDQGAWIEAEVLDAPSVDTWAQWRAEVDLAAGPHEVEVRAVDGTGEVQSAGPVPPAPDGAEGWHRVGVVVA